MTAVSTPVASSGLPSLSAAAASAGLPSVSGLSSSTVGTLAQATALQKAATTAAATNQTVSASAATPTGFDNVPAASTSSGTSFLDGIKDGIANLAETASNGYASVEKAINAVVTSKGSNLQPGDLATLNIQLQGFEALTEEAKQMQNTRSEMLKVWTQQ